MAQAFLPVRVMSAIIHVVSHLILSYRDSTLFGNPETAKYVLQLFLSINDQVDDAIRALENKASPEEYKAFQGGVGHAMYEAFEQILVPICKRHPSLRPPEMDFLSS